MLYHLKPEMMNLLYLHRISCAHMYKAYQAFQKVDPEMLGLHTRHQQNGPACL